MGFLEVQASDRYRLLVASSFGWISGGPIMNMRVSRKAQEQLKARLKQIALVYEDQARADAHLPLQDRPPLSV